MKLREFKFNDIPLRGLSIMKDGKDVKTGFISEVLSSSKVIALADMEIKDTRTYFDIFVIEV